MQVPLNLASMRLPSRFRSGWGTVCDDGFDLLDAMVGRGRPNRNVPDPILGWGVDLYARRLRLRSGREM